MTSTDRLPEPLRPLEPLEPLEPLGVPELLEPPEPLLAPPGAGLPTAELLVGRCLFALARLRSRGWATGRFQCERAAIGALTRDVSPEQGCVRVLIERPAGLEDSSRYWSLWMTLDHLRIIHDSIARVITSLARGERPAHAASTAAVKPSPSATAAVREEFERSCDAVLTAVAAVPDLRTAVRYAHPWFGLLDAAGWHAMAAMHLGLHRGQIERILAGLRAA